MVAREQFQLDLKSIKDELIELAKDTEDAFVKAVDALYNQDIVLASQIIENDKRIDKKELAINNKAVLLIAKQQPVAKDLRRLIIAIKITTDLERMGDHAKNIADATIELGEHHLLTIHPALKEMRDIAIDMVRVAINAMVYEDISVARKLSRMDDSMDKRYETIIREMLEETATDPGKVQYVMQMAFSARYIERFADHITNIGESILFLVKGESFNLN